jgi:hypothetical protein
VRCAASTATPRPPLALVCSGRAGLGRAALHHVRRSPRAARRQAQIYLAGSYGPSAVLAQKKSLPQLPPPPQNSSHPPPHPPHPPPHPPHAESPRSGRPPVRKGLHSGGSNEPRRLRLGGKGELEAALSSAQTALVMAKERVATLEGENAALRQRLGGEAVIVTREKLAEAQQLLQDQLLTEADFAAIKHKYMKENYGVAPGAVPAGGASAAQPDIT